MNIILRNTKKKLLHNLRGKINLPRLSSTFRIRFGKRYVLLGHPLAHSMSPYIHRRIMKEAGIRGTYRLYEVPADHLEKEWETLKDRYDGFNVTIPLKEKVVDLLENIVEPARKMRTVNTVWDQTGYNTDLAGFESARIQFRFRSVLLLGSGGTARVMAHAAAAGRARHLVISSRNERTAGILMDELRLFYPETQIECQLPDASPRVFDIALNATPLGMWPHCDGIPVSDEQLRKLSYVYDCVYNPIATRLVLKARNLGIRADNGLGMLVFQALEAQKIWNPDAFFSKVNPAEIQKSLKRQFLKKYPIKIVLTGFMGSGKTLIGKKLAKALGIRFADLDHRIIEEKRKTIAAIFRDDGEDSFRTSEQLCLKKLLHEPDSLVISTGGGALINPENVSFVRKNCGFIFTLEVTLDVALERIGDRADRPLIAGADRSAIEKLYRTRMPVYQEIADYCADGTKTPSEVVSDLCGALGLSGSDIKRKR